MKDGWVLYALHPQKGRFVFNEGVVLVGDQRIVCGGARQGFFASPVPEDAKARIHENDSIPLPNGAIIFPNIFMLAPEMRQMAADVGIIAKAGFGEITHPHEIVEDEILPMSKPSDGGSYSVPR